MKAQELLKRIKLSPESQSKIRNVLQERRHQRIIQFFESCAQCKGALRFVYFKQIRNTIMERAHCDACGKNSKTRTFKLN